MKRNSHSELTNGTGQFEKWVRLPSRPGERLHGCSRALIYTLIDARLVRSASLKQPGKLTGVRLIWEQSLIDYIEKHSTPVEKAPRMETAHGKG